MRTEKDRENQSIIFCVSLILCVAGMTTFFIGLAYFGPKKNQGLLGLNCSSGLEDEILSAWSNSTANASQTDIARDLMEKSCIAVFNCATSLLITGAAITASQLLSVNNFCNTVRAPASTAPIKLQTFPNSTDLGEIITPTDNSDKNCLIVGGCLTGAGAIATLIGFWRLRISKHDSTDDKNAQNMPYGVANT